MKYLAKLDCFKQNIKSKFQNFKNSAIRMQNKKKMRNIEL